MTQVRFELQPESCESSTLPLDRLFLCTVWNACTCVCAVTGRFALSHKFCSVCGDRLGVGAISNDQQSFTVDTSHKCIESSWSKGLLRWYWSLFLMLFLLILTIVCLWWCSDSTYSLKMPKLYLLVFCLLAGSWHSWQVHDTVDRFMTQLLHSFSIRFCFLSVDSFITFAVINVIQLSCNRFLPPVPFIRPCFQYVPQPDTCISNRVQSICACTLGLY